MAKVSLVLNTYNEGKDVAWTVESFRQSAGDVEFEAVVVADGTTDGSVDDLPDDVLVLKPTERLGCGKAKDVAVQHATGDVILHADAHNRMTEGTLDRVAEICIDEPCVWTPELGPLTCDHACKRNGERDCDVVEDWDQDKCSIECPHYTDRLDRGGVQRGGKVRLENPDKKFRGLWVDYPGWDRKYVEGVNPSTFAYSRETLERIGGWNRYPGWWGAQELGLTLRCLFTDTLIRLDRESTVLHRFRSWNHPEGRAVAPYSVPGGHRSANAIYAHRVVFGEALWSEFWEPFFRRTRGDEDAWGLLDESDVEQQRDEFQQLKAFSDRAFWDKYLDEDFPLDRKVRASAHRAAYFIGAGLGNALMCVPAIKALSRAAGEPVDLVDKGLHQDGTRDLLDAQPWVRKVVTETPDLQHYRLACGSRWADLPGLLPPDITAGEAMDGGWRTTHEVEQNMEAARQVGYDGITPSPALGEIPVAEANLPSDYIAIGAGCAGYESKEYPHWQQVGEILQDAGVPVVWVGADDADKAWMDEIGTNLCGATTISSVAGILWQARLYVGIDNGLSHLSAAVRTPSIVLYGPSAERKNIPWTTTVEVLRSGRFENLQEHGCGPCWETPRPGDCQYKAENCRPCMDDISPGWVAARVLRSLDSPGYGAMGTRSLHLSMKQRAVNAGCELDAEYAEFEWLADQLRGEQVHRVLDATDGRWARMIADMLQQRCDVFVLADSPDAEATEYLRERGSQVESGENMVSAQAWAGRVGADVAVVDKWSSWEPLQEIVHHGGYLIVPDCYDGGEREALWRTIQHEHQSSSVRGEVSRGIGLIRLPTASGSDPIL